MQKIQTKRGKGNPRKSDCSLRQVARYDAHFAILEKRRPIQIATMFKKKLEELHKLHPQNKYKLQTVLNKQDREIKIIKLIEGRLYKKPKEQRIKAREERHEKEKKENRDIS